MGSHALQYGSESEVKALLASRTRRSHLARVRRSLDLTQGDVAGALGLSARTVMRWEQSGIKPRRVFAQALSRLYGVPEDVLWPETA